MPLYSDEVYNTKFYGNPTELETQLFEIRKDQSDPSMRSVIETVKQMKNFSEQLVRNIYLTGRMTKK
jgi:hypothetical protein